MRPGLRSPLVLVAVALHEEDADVVLPEDEAVSATAEDVEDRAEVSVVAVEAAVASQEAAVVASREAVVVEDAVVEATRDTAKYLLSS